METPSRSENIEREANDDDDDDVAPFVLANEAPLGNGASLALFAFVFARVFFGTETADFGTAFFFATRGGAEALLLFETTMILVIIVHYKKKSVVLGF